MILTGLARLGRDAELRQTSGDSVCNLALAFNYGKKGGDGNKPTQWVDATLWGKRAESLAQYLTKGTMIDVVLEEPHIETYQKSGGEQGFKLVARVINLEFAGRPPQAQQTQQAPAQQQRQQPQQRRPAPDDDDSIPF